MKVLLVSDTQTTKSAATVYVRSGALNDPPEVNGIAHFCEHMLFMGSKKFPKISEFADWLSSNGGSRNAATGEDFTFFYFDVKNESLDQALERFSDFFAQPLFTKEATDTEVNQIESEFVKNKASELRRVIQVEKTELYPNNAARSRFTTGNKESLKTDPESKGIDICEKLKEYHDKNYSSNIMSLCVVGSQTLDEL